MHTILATVVFFSHSLTWFILHKTQFEFELLLMLPILLLFGYEHRTVFFFKRHTRQWKRNNIERSKKKKKFQPNTVAACTSTTALSVRHTNEQDENFVQDFCM